MTTEILHRDDLRRGGFAGLREHRIVMDPGVFGPSSDSGAWRGLGKFVYLADARFLPHGETRLHPHHEIDVISVMVEGRIGHEGSLEHGQELTAPDVQVQRAGGEGFQHNEVNPDDVENRMIQLWVLPETNGEPADYKLYRPTTGSMTRVYGGKNGQTETFAAATVIEVGMLTPGQVTTAEGQFLAYVTSGAGVANGIDVSDGDLVRGDGLHFEASRDAHIIVVRLNP